MYSIEIDRYKYLLKNREGQIEALELKVQGWKADAKSWESTAASMATELDDLEQEADSLTDRNEALAELLTEAQVRAKKAENEFESANKEIGRLLKTIDNLSFREDKAGVDLAQCRKALHDAIAEAAEIENERDAWRERYRQDADPDLRKSKDRRIAELEGRLAKDVDRADRFADMLDTTITERDALVLDRDAWKTHAQGLSKSLDAAHRDIEYLKSAQSEAAPVPAAVIDGQGDCWKLNHDSGLYEYGIFNRTLDNIELNWGIEERIY